MSTNYELVFNLQKTKTMLMTFLLRVERPKPMKKLNTTKIMLPTLRNTLRTMRNLQRTARL
jgi:hypothetical protein